MTLVPLGEAYAAQTSGRTQPYWFDETRPFFRRRLNADVDVDVAVVGAGMAGVLTAYRLAVAGKKVALVEERAIGAGESGRTTAHFTHALDDRYSTLESMHGAEGARKAADSHTLAIREIERIVREEGIRCDLERVDGYLFLHPNDKVERLDDEFSASRRAGLGVERVDKAPGPFDTGPCIRYPDQVQLQPMKLLAGLIARIEREGGAVFTESRVEAAKDGLSCNGRAIRAPRVLACTNVPFHTKVAMHAKQAAYRTYVIAATLTTPVPKALWWDTGEQGTKAVAAPYHYVRVHSGPQGDTLLVGGEDHKTGHPQRGDPFQRLEEWTRARFPVRKVTHAWSGQVVEPFDHLAFIGPDPTDRANGLVTGDSGNGMTHAVIASMLLADAKPIPQIDAGDLDATDAHPWGDIYDPGRKVVHGLPAFLKEGVGDVVAKYTDYVRPSHTRAARLRPGEGMVQHGLRPKAIYRNAKGHLVECSAVCPHLGCLVRWNKVEGSFDCPCHGSRFSPDGRRVNGPADTGLQAISPEERSHERAPRQGIEAEAPRFPRRED